MRQANARLHLYATNMREFSKNTPNLVGNSLKSRLSGRIPGSGGSCRDWNCLCKDRLVALVSRSRSTDNRFNLPDVIDVVAAHRLDHHPETHLPALRMRQSLFEGLCGKRINQTEIPCARPGK